MRFLRTSSPCCTCTFSLLLIINRWGRYTIWKSLITSRSSVFMSVWNTAGALPKPMATTEYRTDSILLWILFSPRPLGVSKFGKTMFLDQSWRTLLLVPVDRTPWGSSAQWCSFYSQWNLDCNSPPPLQELCLSSIANIIEIRTGTGWGGCSLPRSSP